MSSGAATRFRKGQSGNSAGRPKKRRPNVSAFDIIFDKTLTVMQNGKERELTVDEALQLQTYQAALKGSKMAIRQVLKTIEKREAALTKRNTLPPPSNSVEIHHDADNADEVMRILGITVRDPAFGDDRPRMNLATWVVQAALSRPGRKRFEESDIRAIKQFTRNADQLKWPRGRLA